MTTSACTFAATPGPLYGNFTKVTSQPGCCITGGDGTITSAYGLNNTCHVLLYMGEAAPYRLTSLAQNAGNLSLSTGQCDAMVIQIQNMGVYSTGNGTGPQDAGLASRYGYSGCVFGASANPTSASSKTSAAAPQAGRFLRARGLCLLAVVLPLLLL